MRYACQTCRGIHPEGKCPLEKTMIYKCMKCPEISDSPNNILCKCGKAYLSLSLNRKISFMEPYMVHGEYMGDCTIVLSIANAIRAERIHRNNEDLNQATALRNFMAVHWARFEPDDRTP